MYHRLNSCDEQAMYTLQIGLLTCLQNGVCMIMLKVVHETQNFAGWCVTKLELVLRKVKGDLVLVFAMVNFDCF